MLQRSNTSKSQKHKHLNTEFFQNQQLDFPNIPGFAEYGLISSFPTCFLTEMFELLLVHTTNPAH